ncbi:hypothetical protein PC110_g16161 [Phytophthora cactorum]|uniref:Uncharacterized protein n=1 Tax=Phytophthora cactorum TaxID=29920 RepID=A0A329RSC6_9STRA|nr:hypothetical protein PC110_g16161 [Phytophthora cactorum]
MEPKVSCVNHAAIVEGYYMGKLSLREGSLQIPLTAFIRLACANTSVEKSTAAARRQRKRETAARRRAERLEELTAQGKFVPLSDRVRNALQHAYDRFGGARFVLRDFLPSFQEGTGALPDVLNSLQEMPSTEVLDDGNVHHNRTDYLQVATVSGAQVVLPAGSSFAQRDVRTLHQLALGRHKLILMDPPWQNKSVSRGKRYDMLDHSELLKIHVPHIADPDECILAVWVTNRPRYMAYLREQALPSWGFTYHTCWYWLKLSKNGELVTPLDSTHRLPVETLAVAYRAKDQAHEQTLRQRLGEQMRIVLSIPLRHSWKPPLECFFDKDIMSTTHRKVELFARELRPHWTSVGNEVLKFQATDLFQSTLPPTYPHPAWREFRMSKREQELEAECEDLRSELRVMEELVQRYQDELTAVRNASFFRHNPKNTPDLHRVEEELFENQNLAPRGSAMRASKAELPVLCRANGEEMRFSAVKLPSQNWEWVSDWHCDVHAQTDESGWMYAESWEQLGDINQLHYSEQTMSARVRQRRWKRERMLIRSTGLPATLNQSLLTKSRLAAMRYANEKLTQQLLRANGRIEELEKRDKIYEAHMLKLQQVAEELSNDLYARSFDLHDPVAVPYTVSKSTEVLKQTEELLGDMLMEQGLARLDTLAVTSEVQRRRSEILAACENELQNTMDEFNDLVRTLERTQSPPPEQ